MSVELLRRLIETEDSVHLIWELLTQTIWTYEQYLEHEADEYFAICERKTSELERNINAVYFEIYERIFEQSLKEQKLKQLLNQDAYCLIIFDGLSLREAPVIANTLAEAGYHVNQSYVLAQVPSETEAFTQYVFGYDSPFQMETKSSLDFQYHFIVDDSNTEMSFIETSAKKVFWTRFPDVLLHGKNKGKTQILSFQEILQRTLTILKSLLKIKAKEIVITSDHGYINLAPGCFWDLPGSEQKLIGKEFGWGRSTSTGLSELEHLPNRVKVIPGYASILGRYAWPTKGQASALNHGGLSFMEVIVPYLVARKSE